MRVVCSLLALCPSSPRGHGKLNADALHNNHTINGRFSGLLGTVSARRLRSLSAAAVSQEGKIGAHIGHRLSTDLRHQYRLTDARLSQRAT
jgi:hypothetical protein